MSWAAIAALLIGGGGLGALVGLLFRIGPERRNLQVDLSKGAVLVQSGVIEDLQDQNDRLKAELDELRKQLGDLFSLQRRVYELERDLARVREDNITLARERDAWKREAEELHTQVEGLRGRIATLERGNGA